MYNPQIWGKEWITYICLPAQANIKIFQNNPTLASGDAKISKDGAAEANLATLPAVTPAGGRRVKVTVSATEMQCDNASVVLHDAAGDEWCDVHINIQPTKLVGAGAVDNTGFSPTTTVFETNIVEATANHLVNRLVQFISGALAGPPGQIARITAYSLVSGRGRITVSGFTEAPADGDLFVLL